MRTSNVHSERIERLRHILREKKVDAFLVAGKENIFYLTGFTGSTGMLYVTMDSAELITDSRYMLQCKKEVKEADVSIYKSKSEFIKYLHRLKGNVIGFNPLKLNYHTYLMYKRTLKNKKMKNCGMFVEILRQVKDKHELNIIKRAVKRAEKSINETLGLLREDESELDIKNRLEGRIRQNGCDKEAFDTIVVSGKNSAVIHGAPAVKKIKRGELILIDFGVRYKNYVTDQTVTVMIGEAKKRHKEVYGIVKEANEIAISKIKDGVSSKYVYNVAMDFIKKNGYGGNFLHGLGHGIGLEVHEAPLISPSEDTLLKEGMIVTIEPGIYIENFGGIRIEDMVYITKTGSKVLTKGIKSLEYKK